jgi:hypothetical protein
VVHGLMAGEFIMRFCLYCHAIGICTETPAYIIFNSVETHDEGRVIVFDDSRNHRAFCYGDDERIVLILDLERPESLPKGTATGKNIVIIGTTGCLHT